MESLRPDNNRCRLCGREEKGDSFVDMFDEEQQLEMKITKLLPIVVMPWDPMPHKVCLNCVKKLNSLNDFYNETLKTERFLRALYPSAPETEIENQDPMVLINDQVRTFRNPLKLFPKNLQGTLKPSIRRNESVAHRKSEPLLSASRPKTLEGFIVNPITRTDSVFTCQKCFSIFTKETTAISHSCVGIEEKSEESHPERHLPPLKIRLITFQSGKFVCSLCQNLFVSKLEVVEHLQTHFKGEGSKEKRKKKVASRKRKEKRNSEIPRKKSRFEDSSEDVHNNSENQRSTKNLKIDDQPPAIPCSDGAEIGKNSEVEVPDTSPSKDTNTDRSSPEIYIIEEDDEKNGDKETVSEFHCCKVCEKVFVSEPTLMAHHRKHLQETHKSYEEDDSNTVTSSSEAVVYICKLCDEAFSEMKNLTRHHATFCNRAEFQYKHSIGS